MWVKANDDCRAVITAAAARVEFPQGGEWFDGVRFGENEGQEVYYY
jgi:hypothetical protein